MVSRFGPSVRLGIRALAPLILITSPVPRLGRLQGADPLPPGHLAVRASGSSRAFQGLFSGGGNTLMLLCSTESQIPVDGKAIFWARRRPTSLDVISLKRYSELGRW